MSLFPPSFISPSLEEQRERIAKDIARAVILLRPGQTLTVQRNHDEPWYTLSVQTSDG